MSFKFNKEKWENPYLLVKNSKASSSLMAYSHWVESWQENTKQICCMILYGSFHVTPNWDRD